MTIQSGYDETKTTVAIKLGLNAEFYKKKTEQMTTTLICHY